MDRVRFGRALGMGTREAGRALKRAAEAAAAPDPAAGPNVAARAAGRVAAARTVQAREEIREAGVGVKRGSKRFGEAIWGPFWRLSGVLWLEVTGVFFGLFALTAAVEVWKRHADFLVAGEGRLHAGAAVLMLVVFSYFTVSSFVRARRRGRG